MRSCPLSAQCRQDQLEGLARVFTQINPFAVAQEHAGFVRNVGAESGDAAVQRQGGFGLWIAGQPLVAPGTRAESRVLYGPGEGRREEQQNENYRQATSQMLPFRVKDNSAERAEEKE